MNRFVPIMLVSTTACGLLPSLQSQAIPASSRAAEKAGQLRIHVRDTRAVSLAAKGTLYGPTAGRSRPVESAADGSLLVEDLPPGQYILRLSRAGFAEHTLSLTVLAGQATERDVTLTVGGFNTSITVVASSPIGGVDVPLSNVPLPVQTLSAQTLQDTHAIDLTDAMKRRLNGVYVNENQNNPFQPDVNYRGYAASPLVGSPAGLSVYLDGVRQNQPFGDVVQWDLIPKVAIASMELIPGSNPAYGLNTLGGAIAVQTKDGVTHSGVAVSGYGGSFGRRAVDMEYGGSKKLWNWFAAGTLFHEDGWRVQSPSSVRQSFAKLGYQHGATVLAISGGYSINNLTGNGTQDFRAIQRTTGLNHGYGSVYSIPDATYQHEPFVTVNLTHVLTNTLSVNLNAYERYTRTDTTNGDINDDSFDQSLYTLSKTDMATLTHFGIAFPTSAITAANTPFPYLRCLAASLSLSVLGITSAEPAEKCDGEATDSTSRQHAIGVTGAVSWNTAHNKLSVGAGFNRGSLTYVQNSQWGYLNPDGITITRVPSFDDGSEVNDDGSMDDDRVNLHGITTTPSVYVTDTFSWKRLVLNGSGRYNHTDINNMDRLPKAASGRPGLTADNKFQRFNPAVGVVFKGGKVDAYMNYSESSRAPTSTELGCADPNFPCSLPNALVSDPPLKQVVARTVEFGLRGNQDGRYRWNAGYFHTNNDDDLLFVASQATGFGYFQNFGRTRRQGVEAAASTHLHNLEAGIAYTYLDATYQSSQVIEADSNSSNSNALSGLKGVPDGGLITISPGNHIPQIPQNLLKVFVESRPLKNVTVSVDFNLIGQTYARGNENNQHQPDGVYYLGRGISPGYGIVNLGTSYRVSSHYEVFAELNNLFNRHYYTAAQLATTPYDGAGNFVARPFPAYTTTVAGGDPAYAVRNTTYLSPGAPITIFGGLRVSFGKHSAL